MPGGGFRRRCESALGGLFFGRRRFTHWIGVDRTIEHDAEESDSHDGGDDNQCPREAVRIGDRLSALRTAPHIERKKLQASRALILG